VNILSEDLYSGTVAEKNWDRRSGRARRRVSGRGASARCPGLAAGEQDIGIDGGRAVPWLCEP
jgi:hypothetical protein